MLIKLIISKKDELLLTSKKLNPLMTSPGQMKLSVMMVKVAMLQRNLQLLRSVTRPKVMLERRIKMPYEKVELLPRVMKPRIMLPRNLQQKNLNLLHSKKLSLVVLNSLQIS